ncbi:dihydrofolate synthase [Sporobolomyces koalae]|uniref:dihydrofolate synthase n=1 Tax=Sporobolomyces koalae TaxID=500713 RepID=UPI003181BBB3
MIALGLSRITRLLKALKSPHCQTPIVHIAGTNGKGSVSAYIASVLHHSHLKVGRFNSPHLVDEWDCVRLEEQVVDEHQFRQAKLEVETLNAREGFEATPFEILTATAFSLFARKQLDIAVVEVGMGGEGDATNVVPQDQTLLSVLTAVDLDHQGFLGNTVQEIARVKSGIVRRNGNLVVSRQVYPQVLQVAKEVARERDATVWPAQGATFSDDTTLASIPLASVFSTLPLRESAQSDRRIAVHLPLPGSYQLDNAATAVLAIELLRNLPRTTQLVPQLATITDETIRSGIQQTRWDGRLQWLDLTLAPLSPPQRVLLDGAHNPSSASVLAEYVKSLPVSDRPSTLIFGLSAPRAAAEVLTPLLQVETGIKQVLCVGFSPPVGMPWVRATPADELVEAVKAMKVESELKVVAAFNNVEEALKASSSSTTVVAGSLYLVADALRLARRQGHSKSTEESRSTADVR